MLWWRRRQAKSKDASVRCRAATGLRKHVSSDGIRVLTELLFDGDPAVVAAAAAAVRNSPNGAAVSFLKDELGQHGDRWWRNREWAGKALGFVGDPALSPDLALHLDDPHHKVCEAIARSLSTLGWQPQSTRERALFAMGLGDWDTVLENANSVVSELVRTASTADLNVAMRAGLALANTNDYRAVDALVELQWRAVERTSLRTGLNESIARLGLKPVELSFLEEGDGVQDSVAIALSRMNDSLVLNRLRGILKDVSKDPKLRAGAAWCLGSRSVNDEESFNTLFIHANSDIDAGVEEACKQALVILGTLLAKQEKENGKPPSGSAEKSGKQDKNDRR